MKTKYRESLKKARKRVTDIMRACDIIEKSAGESQRLLSTYTNDINNEIERAKVVSSVIDHDV